MRTVDRKELEWRVMVSIEEGASREELHGLVDECWAEVHEALARAAFGNEGERER
jgi:hypothetical protein